MKITQHPWTKMEDALRLLLKQPLFVPCLLCFLSAYSRYTDSIGYMSSVSCNKKKTPVIFLLQNYISSSCQPFLWDGQLVEAG